MEDLELSKQDDEVNHLKFLDLLAKIPVFSTSLAKLLIINSVEVLFVVKHGLSCEHDTNNGQQRNLLLSLYLFFIIFLEAEFA
jgi:hypothetical protein